MNLRWRIAQFFEIRWWQRYLSRRDKAGYLDWKRRYWQEFLQKAGLTIPPNASVLDAGCGPAGIFMALENQTVVALDPLLDHYEKTLSLFRQSDYPHIFFIKTALEDFSSDTMFEFVFCLNVINHVADLPRCISRLVGLTAPGGTLAVSIDAHNHTWLKRFFRFVPADILHPHQHDLEEYQSMFTARGFQLKKTILMKNGLIFNYFLLVLSK